MDILAQMCTVSVCVCVSACSQYRRALMHVDARRQAHAHSKAPTNVSATGFVDSQDFEALDIFKTYCVVLGSPLVEFKWETPAGRLHKYHSQSSQLCITRSSCCVVLSF